MDICIPEMLPLGVRNEVLASYLQDLREPDHPHSPAATATAGSTGNSRALWKRASQTSYSTRRKSNFHNIIIIICTAPQFLAFLMLQQVLCLIDKHYLLVDLTYF